MSNLESFLSDNSNVCLYTGGAGRGGTYAGILKFSPYLDRGYDCSIVSMNRKSLISEIYEYVQEIYPNASFCEREMYFVFPKGSKLYLDSPESQKGRELKAVFVDNANQLDEKYPLSYFIRPNRIVWLNSNTKCRGFVFDLIKPLLIDCGEYYALPQCNNGCIINGVRVIHGTCLDNPNLIQELDPEYASKLLCLSRPSRHKLFYGHYYKDSV